MRVDRLLHLPSDSRKHHLRVHPLCFSRRHHDPELFPNCYVYIALRYPFGADHGTAWCTSFRVRLDAAN